MEMQNEATVPTFNRTFTEIIQDYKDGCPKDYDILCSYLSASDIPDRVFIGILRELQENVSLLGKDMEVFVGIILKLEWLDRTETARKEYQSFVLNLVSANTLYLRTCLKKLVMSFLPQMQNAQGNECVDVSNVQQEADDGKFMKVHKLLRMLVKIVPMSPAALLPLLEESFPFIHKDTYSHECYVKNLLHLSCYLRIHRRKILEIIIDRMLRLDVRTPREELHEAEGDSEDEELDDEIFEMEEFKSKSGKVENCLIPMTHKNAGCLDSLMELVFLFIKNTCYPSEQFDWEATKEMYKDLLQIFDRIILPTHASCHVQFLMFYILSFHTSLVEGFIDYLLKRVHDPNTQPIFRSAAVAYLASLVARAQYISTAHIKSILELLTAWIHRYIQHIGIGPFSHVSIAHHGPFYSVCQAVFYIFAFRHKELWSMPDGPELCKALNLQSVITSKLNPLKVCLPIVADTFSSIARCHQLAFCDTIIERNKRNQIPEAGSTNNANPSTVHTQLNPLDSFFPFDPYLLNRSGKFITPLYKEFEGKPVQMDNHVEEEDDEDNDFMEMDIIKENTLSTSLGDKNTDFMMYGLSPGFKSCIK